jgi:hypothetical protein
MAWATVHHTGPSAPGYEHRRAALNLQFQIISVYVKYKEVKTYFQNFYSS